MISKPFVKTYRKLIRIPTFEERFEYLKLSGQVGRETFGPARYLNQSFYRSREWKRLRDYILVRDNGCDLGIDDREIFSQVYIHHINPITIDDIERGDDAVFDPNNLISTSFETHNAIHYGNESNLIKLPKVRQKGDTCLW